MTATNVETKADQNGPELSRATRISSGLGLLKVLLILAPFTTFSSCGGHTPVSFVGWLQLGLSMRGEPALLGLWGLFVPFSGLFAACLILFVRQWPVERVGTMAKWMIVLSAVSLSAVLFIAWLTAGGPDFIQNLHWGFWGLVGADVTTIVLLWVALANTGGRETQAAGAMATTKSAGD